MARVKTSPLYLHPCPRCGAAIGEACATANGKSKPGGHAQRRALAGMKPDKSGTSHAVRRARTGSTMSSTRTTGWIPEEAMPCPPVEREAIAALVHVAAELLHRGPKLLDLGRALSRASKDLDAVLLGYRVEAVLVRRALRLPTTATTDEVLRALERREEP